MKARALKFIDGQLIDCLPQEATHVQIKLPGPVGERTLPVITHGKREGTGCWTWNADAEKPTLRPSLLVTSGHFTEGGGCWCEFYRQHPPEPGEKSFACYRCHTWVNDGRAQFLPDTSHELAGQTVDLLDILPS